MAYELTSHEGARKLDAEAVESYEFADTTTSSGSNSDVQGEQWMSEVIHDAEAQRHFEDIARVDRSLVGNGDDTAHIPVTSDHLDISTTGTGEGAARTYTEMDKLSTVDVTVSGNDWKKGGIALSKEFVQTARVNAIQLARYHVAQELAQEVDEDIRSQVVTDTPGAHNVNNSSSGLMTPDAISNAMEFIQTDNYVPRWLVISPGHAHDLRTDSQFSNAAEFGSDAVVQDGDITQYLGLNIMMSSNITNDANNKATMVGTNPQGQLVGPALVWKEDPNIAMEYDQEESEHRIFLNQAYATDTLQSDALATIQTA